MANLKCSQCNENRNIYEAHDSSGTVLGSYLLCPRCDVAAPAVDPAKHGSRKEK